MRPKQFKRERKAVTFTFLAGFGLVAVSIGIALLVAFVSQFNQAW
ncbi:hypothetical protein [Thiomicrorhabdus lithotrophica]|uniref:Uncharacterized protein n=1 Tax=Thiomicrorhabdus lithotrophica TaxID=2949997 RepID=A0ABY8C9G2_9GAMM|nr:hypothetical protein [Thiomicrorhabdus lithotrophica]WEJ62172.1 hypothetical protein NR989_09140 [Thiomicrorhabdus lithotrophica]